MDMLITFEVTLVTTGSSLGPFRSVWSSGPSREDLVCNLCLNTLLLKTTSVRERNALIGSSLLPYG